MAYMSQETKAKIAAKLKAVMPKDWKYTLSVRDHSTIVMTIKSAPFPLIEMINAQRKINADYRNKEYYPVERGYCDVNLFYVGDVTSEPAVLEVLQAAKSALYDPEYYYDKSDVQTDYFNCAYYASMQIGSYDKPFTTK